MRWRIGSKSFLASAEVRRRNRAKWTQPDGVKITDATAEESRSVGSTHPAWQHLEESKRGGKEEEQEGERVGVLLVCVFFCSVLWFEGKVKSSDFWKESSLGEWRALETRDSPGWQAVSCLSACNEGQFVVVVVVVHVVWKYSDLASPLTVCIFVCYNPPMSMLQKHCKEEEEEELAGDLSEICTYFCHVFVRERHYWETHILHTQLK
jgi:hypothetical protein